MISLLILIVCIALVWWLVRHVFKVPEPWPERVLVVGAVLVVVGVILVLAGAGDAVASVALRLRS